MTTRSTFGDQPLSVKKSAPAFGFGSSSRDTAAKVFVSQQHTIKSHQGRGSPGPATILLPASVGGKQPDGRKHDPPVWTFGTGKARGRPGSAPIIPAPGHYDDLGRDSAFGAQVLGRRGKTTISAPTYGFGTAERKHVRKVFVSSAHQKVDMYGLASPGPATYGMKTTMGKQDESVMASDPSWVFGGASRTPVEAGMASPGPAAYSLPESVGVQPDSRRAAAPQPSFGSGTRAHREKVFLGPGHEKGVHGRQTPGPAAPYETISAVGGQVHSKMRSAPAPSFSRASRWASYEKESKANSTPGPGAY